MALFKSLQAAQGLPIPVGDRATDLLPIFADYTVVEMVPWPKGYVPVDVIADVEDCGTTVTTDVGLMSGAYGDGGTRTCGAEFMNDKAFGTAGIYRADVLGFSRLAPSTTDRSIGLALASVSTPTAGAKIRLTVIFRPAIEGV
jgi:hypothetical protein